MTPSHFVFATCHPGLEGALKHELLARYTPLRLAFSRPGFITLKHPDQAVDPQVILTTMLARRYGVSLGPVRGVDDVVRQAGALAAAGGPLRLHVWQCDGGVERASAWETALRGAGSCWLPAEPPRHGEPVMDVIAVDAATWWTGWHCHGATHAPHVGGVMPLSVPEAAPSRAYGKWVEALSWSGAAVQPGELALELGSAPGGTTYALLTRGLHVTAVDPAEMAPQVAALAAARGVRFSHVQKPVSRLQSGDVPAAHWLFSDMNIAPSAVLAALQRLLPALQSTLRGVLMNWKINDSRVAARLPHDLARLQGLGFGQVRAAHLGQHRREIAVWARYRARR